MARVKRAVNAQKKRRTALEAASGYRGQRSRLYRKAKEQLLHSATYSYRDRKARKGDFRQLWITRINAAARANDMTYNRFIQGLRLAGVQTDRKVLADLAVTDAPAFAALVAVAKQGRRGRGHRRRCRSDAGCLTCSARTTPGSRRPGGSPAARSDARPGVFLPRAPRPCARPWPAMQCSSCSPPPKLSSATRALTADADEISVKDAAALSETVTPQGLVAVCALGNPPSPSCWRPSRGCSRCWSNPTIRATLGTIIRTADAAGADAVVLDGGVDPHNGKAVRASAGSLFHLPIVAAPVAELSSAGAG